MAREIGLRVAVLTGILQRAELIKEDEQVVEVEWDEQTNQVILYLE